MQKMFFMDENDLKKVQLLLINKIDNEYVVLQQNNRLADIVQYSAKYQNVHLACVPVDKLDPLLRLYNA